MTATAHINIDSKENESGKKRYWEEMILRRQ